MVTFLNKEGLPMKTMEEVMDILALHRQGFSKRYIAAKLGIHRDTVTRFIENKGPPQYPHKKDKKSILEPYRQFIDDHLESDNFRATWLFDRIRHLGYNGGYDTVKIYVRGVKERLSRLAFIRFETEPGKQAQVDWGDFQIIESFGATSTVHAFVMLLGFSRAMYVEFVDRCTLEAFMDCHMRAFQYLRGVSAEILYDNMKNVVAGRKNGNARFNIEFLDFARHYQFQPRACPPYSPWVKGKVERPMDYLRERFWRGYTFQSIEQANIDVLKWLDEIANKRVHGTHRKPVGVQWNRETGCLGELPAKEYDTSLKVYRKVYKDCQVSYNCNWYVLPESAVGHKILLKIKNGIIRFYDDDQLLTTYPESEGKHNLVVNPMFYEQLKKDRLQNKRKYGRKKGKATRSLVNSSLYPEVSHRPLSEYEVYAQGGGSWKP
jgi:transposase